MFDEDWHLPALAIVSRIHIDIDSRDSLADDDVHCKLLVAGGDAAQEHDEEPFWSTNDCEYSSFFSVRIGKCTCLACSDSDESGIICSPLKIR